MRPPVLEFWFDFASTYSYPAAMRAPALARQAGVTIEFRPFLLGPIFKAQGWSTSPFNLFPAKGRYMWRDVARICAGLSLPFRPPQPFPQNSVLAARVALLGLDNEWGEDFCVAVFRAQFADSRRIDDRQTIRDILSALKVDPDATLADAQTDEIKARLRTQTGEAERRELFGAPTFITSDGELFWGNDRLESALQWATRAS